MRSAMEILEASRSFRPHPAALIGAPAMARAWRARRPRIAVDAGQHDAGDADFLAEGFRHRHRVLTGHRVGDQQAFMGMDGVAHSPRRLRPSTLVDREAAGGIQHDDVEPSRRPV